MSLTIRWNGLQINTVDDWFRLAPPKDGRQSLERRQKCEGVGEGLAWPSGRHPPSRGSVVVVGFRLG